MASAPAKRPTFFKIAFLVLIALIILLISLSLISRAQGRNALVLPTGTFTSRIEERRYKKPDGTEGIYYVLNTTSHYKDPVFRCQVDVSAKGSREVFWGFTAEYVEKDCQVFRGVKSQYDCRLGVWVQRFFHQNDARTIERINPEGSYEIPVSWFYKGDVDVSPQTRAKESFLNHHKLDEIYSVITTCNNPAGQLMQHTQVL